MSITASITVTEKAIAHFSHLIKQEEKPGTNLRISVMHPLTHRAEVGVTFCYAGQESKDDIPLDLKDFILYVEKNAEKALEDANIDFKEDKLEGHLSIKAPNLKGKVPAADADIKDKVQYVLDSEINPNLAGHGGRVQLIDILDSDTEAGLIVVLQFGGGCHGCGMAQTTMQQGIEKTLKEKFPEIIEVRDATDHSTGTNPYFN